MLWLNLNTIDKYFTISRYRREPVISSTCPVLKPQIPMQSHNIHCPKIVSPSALAFY